MEERSPVACARVPPPPGRGPADGRLRWTSLPDAPLHLLSAYIDNRLPGFPYVRIIAAVRGPAASPALFCHLRPPDGQTAGRGAVVLAATATPIWAEGWAAEDASAPLALRPLLLSCALPPQAGAGPEREWPEAVTVTTAACAPAAAPAIALASPPTKRQGRFAVCVKGLDFPLGSKVRNYAHGAVSSEADGEEALDAMDSGRTVSDNMERHAHSEENLIANGITYDLRGGGDRAAAVRLVEWLELHRLFGAEHFFVYVTRAGPRVRRVLDAYRRRGILTAIALPPPPPPPAATSETPPPVGVWERRRRELLPYNDCLYRNAGAFEFIVPLDVDEVLVPLGGASWGEALAAMEALQPGAAARTASLAARHALFPASAPALPPSPERPAYLHTLTHVRRAPLSPRADAAAHAKSFVRASPAVAASPPSLVRHSTVTIPANATRPQAAAIGPVTIKSRGSFSPTANRAEGVLNGMDSEPSSTTTKDAPRRWDGKGRESAEHPHPAYALSNSESPGTDSRSVTQQLVTFEAGAASWSPSKGTVPGTGPEAEAWAAGAEELLGACALTVHNHWALRALAPGATRLLPLPARVAQLNHYRHECGRPPLWSEDACPGVWVEDDLLAKRFGPQLRSKAEPVLKALRLLT